MNEYNKKLSDLGNNSAEKILAIVANTVLVIGILLSVIMAVTMWSSRYIPFFTGLLWLVGGIIFSFITWAACMITVNISNNVRQIKQNLQNRPL